MTVRAQPGSLLVGRLAGGEIRRKTMVAMTGKQLIVAIGAALVVSVVPSPAGAQALRVVSARQDVAVARAGEIPALGTVSATLGWDHRMQVSLRESEFVMTRTFTPATREVELTISGEGELPLVLRFGGSDGFSASRGARVARGTSNPEAIRPLLSGRAVAAARRHLGNYERRLISRAPATRSDDPHAYGFLLAGALLASLDGDPTAVGRARDIIRNRLTQRMKAVGFDFKYCVTDYERYLLQIDSDRSNCLEAANGRESWYARAADRLGCEVEFMAGALAGEGQFAACTALGGIIA